MMASGGGGAEFVSEHEARAAIERGEAITIEDAGSFKNLSEISFERAPARGNGVTSHRDGLPAGRDVRKLPSRHRHAGFARMMNAILDGRPFVEALDTGYHQDVQSLWQKFATTGAEAK